mmetsp:Transcript_14545/g.31054  ORF Transcript_14545/g.31054 Transcript_14545/m.31054 type:complete len:205 (-) Transcript_14545:23-637(-)
MVEGSNNKEDDGEDKEAGEIIAMVAKFAKENSQKSDHSKPQNDFDEVFDEMARTVGDLANGNAYYATEKILDGWISMEDNDYCRHVIGEEAQELMTRDALCGLAKVAEEVDDDVNEDSLQNEEDPKELTLDDVNKIATSLKALSVSIDNFPLPPTYSSLGRDVSDASTNLWAAYRNVVGDKTRRKQRKTRQCSALPFFEKQKKD